MEQFKKKKGKKSQDRFDVQDQITVGDFQILDESLPLAEAKDGQFEVMKSDAPPKRKLRAKFETVAKAPAPPVTVVCPRCSSRFPARPGSITRCPVCRGRGFLKKA